MSLLEDVFLQDEASEAQELERVIEGDEYDERPRSPDSDDNSEKEDEAEEEKRRVDPNQTKTKRVVRNPRFVLNPARLTGPRGIQVIPDHFKDFKFKGKGHEKEDLDLVLKKLEHWAYRLYPKFGFEDCLKKIETLGKKRPVMVHLQKIRSDQFLSEETVVQKDSSDEETPMPPQEEDEFDKLLQEQIELARATPAPNSARKLGFTTPSVNNKSPFTMPKATSSPSISDEQRERMLKNRRLAEEKRLARLNSTNASTSKITNNSVINEEETVDYEQITNIEDSTIVNKVRKHNRSNVIDSSDEESEIVTMNEAVTVDIHNFNTITSPGIEENDVDSCDSRTVNNDKDKNTDIDIVENDSVIDINEENLNKNNNLKNNMELIDSVPSNIDRDDNKSVEISECVSDTKVDNVDRNSNTEIDNEPNITGMEKQIIEINVEVVNSKTNEEIKDGLDNSSELDNVTDQNKEDKDNNIEENSIENNTGETEKSSVLLQSSEMNSIEDVMDVDFTDEF